ncbi:hypothetical protein [Actinoplanes sp. M2I2]|uniref:hypothetical protein n=1 Tax=Actinoplanes sp. M2I2 TaxID=1734444 RepID=UPI00202176B8|nr:hypothetical protein [Actinoplanes sp. M2I2]
MRSQLASRGADVVLVTVRELRLMLGLLLILFITSETWRYIGRLATFRLVVLEVATFVAALLVVVLGLRHTLGPSAAAGRAVVRVAAEVVAFGAALFLTFVVVGVISVDAGLVAEWSGRPDGVLLSIGLGDPALVVSRQLLQVAAFLAALGALVFATEVIADAGTRHTLIHDLIEPAADPIAR